MTKVGTGTKEYMSAQLRISHKSLFRYATSALCIIFAPSLRILPHSISQVLQKLRVRKTRLKFKFHIHALHSNHGLSD